MKGCCQVKIKKYKHHPAFYKNSYKKAGVFIYDPIEKKILLVQSRGHLWGPPKGSLHIGELAHYGAIREVKEETGLDVSYDDFTRAVKIRNKAFYFYLEVKSADIIDKINIQNNDNPEENDANGITWINISCLEQAIINGNIVLNYYAKIVFEHFLHKSFPKSNWTIVRKA